MKIRYLIGAAVVAMFVIPGSASEFAASAAQRNVVPGYAVSAFSDPDAEPVLSITLPTKFVAVDTQFDPTQHFTS
jgi:hypothetical protein